MAKPDTAPYKTFDQITDRLDEIVSQVRDKETSLERSLDLFDEAIALGSKAVDMVDRTNFTPEEEAKLRAEADGKDAKRGEKDGGAQAQRADGPQGEGA